MFLCPRYVNDPKFRLMFLRATCFNAREPALLMVGHFKLKSELFSLERFARPITFGRFGCFPNITVETAMIAARGDAIWIPSEKDVLLGRGPSWQRSPVSKNSIWKLLALPESAVSAGAESETGSVLTSSSSQSNKKPRTPYSIF